MRRDLLLSLALGLLGGLLCWWYNPQPGDTPLDLGWSFLAARDLLAGADPYGHPQHSGMIPYPLTAALLVMPFTLLPTWLAIAAFFGLGSALLAYGILRSGERWRLLVFITPSYVMAAKSMQWSPLLMAVLFLPSLAPVLLAKPTMLLPIGPFVAWSWRRIAAAAALGLISMLVMPEWPWRWLEQTREYRGFIPALLGLGPLLVLALLRVRRSPEARLLALLAVTPQQRYYYDQILLYLIPRTPRQMLLLTISGWVALLYNLVAYNTLTISEPSIVALMYLPALGLVFWQSSRYGAAGATTPALRHQLSLARLRSQAARQGRAPDARPD